MSLRLCLVLSSVHGLWTYEDYDCGIIRAWDIKNNPQKSKTTLWAQETERCPLDAKINSVYFMTQRFHVSNWLRLVLKPIT